MRTFILASGGLGGFFGGLLARAGNDVTFVARGANYEAMKNRGLIIKSVIGNFEIKPVKVINNISDIENPDFILFAVKTYDTAEAARQLAERVNENTVIISFQNGVDNDNEIKQYVKNALVVPGVAYVASNLSGPGIISQTGGARRLIFGNRKSQDNHYLVKVQDMMVESGIDAVLSDKITKDLWNKFVFICAFSGLTAICRSAIGKVLSDDSALKSYEDCVREAVAVARGSGVELPATIFEDVMKISRAFTPDSKSSLLVDVENKRQTEIEALNGTLVKFAQQYQLNVPINQLIYSGIKLLSQS